MKSDRAKTLTACLDATRKMYKGAEATGRMMSSLVAAGGGSQPLHMEELGRAERCIQGARYLLEQAGKHMNEAGKQLAKEERQ